MRGGAVVAARPTSRLEEVERPAGPGAAGVVVVLSTRRAVSGVDRGVEAGRDEARDSGEGVSVDRAALDAVALAVAVRVGPCWPRASTDSGGATERIAELALAEVAGAARRAIRVSSATAAVGEVVAPAGEPTWTVAAGRTDGIALFVEAEAAACRAALACVGSARAATMERAATGKRRR